MIEEDIELRSLNLYNLEKSLLLPDGHPDLGPLIESKLDQSNLLVVEIAMILPIHRVKPGTRIIKAEQEAKDSRFLHVIDAVVWKVLESDAFGQQADSDGGSMIGTVDGLAAVKVEMISIFVYLAQRISFLNLSEGEAMSFSSVMPFHAYIQLKEDSNKIKDYMDFMQGEGIIDFVLSTEYQQEPVVQQFVEANRQTIRARTTGVQYALLKLAPVNSKGLK